MGDAVIDLIVKGGIFMYPIIFCSIVALAVFLERLWVLRRKHIIPEEFITSVKELLQKQKISEAIFLCQSDSSSIAKIFLAGLRSAQKGMWLVKEAIEERVHREAAILEKNVGILSTIANLTPLLGLLGTVSGMIKTFNAISVHGIGNPAPLGGHCGGTHYHCRGSLHSNTHTGMLPILERQGLFSHFRDGRKLHPAGGHHGNL